MAETNNLHLIDEMELKDLQLDTERVAPRVYALPAGILRELTELRRQIRELSFRQNDLVRGWLYAQRVDFETCDASWDLDAAVCTIQPRAPSAAGPPEAG